MATIENSGGGGLSELDHNEIEETLKRATSSKQLAGSPRLCDFLSYVVTEAAEGRADRVRAKTIGIDVYGHDASDGGDRENVVRVDAGRLRRKLAEYYDGPGASDPIRISLPVGGYAPHFDRQAQIGASTALRPQRRRLLIALGVAAVIVSGLTLRAFWPTPPDRQSNTSANRSTEREAIFDKSPAALQAVNLAEQGREIIFPAIDRERIAAALTMFERARELDSDYFGGHAGAGQVLATQALLSPPGDARSEVIARAKARAEDAIRLNPASGWSQSALAWVAFAERDFDTANRLSIRARDLSPNDPHVLEFDSLIALFSGHFERVLALGETSIAQSSNAARFVFRNAYASAHFHTGQYAKAAALFQQSSASGAPVSPVTVSYLIAASYEAGDHDAARKAAEGLSAAWPDARVDLLFLNLFSDETFARQIIDPLRKAGWRPKGG